jgi:hypothetical protein
MARRHASKEGITNIQPRLRDRQRPRIPSLAGLRRGARSKSHRPPAASLAELGRGRPERHSRRCSDANGGLALQCQIRRTCRIWRRGQQRWSKLCRVGDRAESSAASHPRRATPRPELGSTSAAPAPPGRTWATVGRGCPSLPRAAYDGRGSLPPRGRAGGWPWQMPMLTAHNESLHDAPPSYLPPSHDRAMKRPFPPDNTCKARRTFRARASGDFSHEK